MRQLGMSQTALKFTLGFHIFQKWIMTDFQRTAAANALLANAVLLVARRVESTPWPLYQDVK